MLVRFPADHEIQPNERLECLPVDVSFPKVAVDLISRKRNDAFKSHKLSNWQIWKRTHILLDVITRKPARFVAKGTFPPTAILALRQCDDIALLEAQFIIIRSLEGILCLHGKLCLGIVHTAANGCCVVLCSLQ